MALIPADEKGPEEKAEMSGKALYSSLDSVRYQFLDRARKSSELTIPTLIPPAGHGAQTKYYTPFQGVGARGGGARGRDRGGDAQGRARRSARLLRLAARRRARRPRDRRPPGRRRAAPFRRLRGRDRPARAARSGGARRPRARAREKGRRRARWPRLHGRHRLR